MSPTNVIFGLFWAVIAAVVLIGFGTHYVITPLHELLAGGTPTLWAVVAGAAAIGWAVIR